jgi:DHA2 family methylenomycin A resistance protein-like MFS transporter
VAALACAAGGLVAFVELERRSRDPMLPLSLFRDPTFASTTAAALLYAGAFFGGVFVLSIEFQDVQGDSPAAAGLRIGIMTVVFGAASLVAGRLAARYGTRGPIISGLALLGIAAAGLAELPASAGLAAQAPLLALTGAGAALVAPSMNAAILASAPASLSGIAGAVLNASRQVGTSLGVALFASCFHGRAAAGAVHMSLGFGAALYFGALLLATRAPASAPRPVPSAGRIRLADH